MISLRRYERVVSLQLSTDGFANYSVSAPVSHKRFE